MLNEIDEEARNKNRSKLIPLRVKWAAMMAGIVAIVMAVSGSIISQRQNAALMQQVADYGTALSRFIAAQNATAALGEDWVSVDVSLQEIMKTRDFESVTVIDRAGVVAASSQPDAVGKPYQAPPGELLGEQGGVRRTRYHAAGGRRCWASTRRSPSRTRPWAASRWACRSARWRAWRGCRAR